MTKLELKQYIAESIRDEFKKYLPLIIKEIRKSNGNVLTETSKSEFVAARLKPKQNIIESLDIPAGNIGELSWLKQMVDPDVMNKQINANRSTPSILDEVNSDVLPDSLTEALTKDYSSLVAKMSEKPVR